MLRNAILVLAAVVFATGAALCLARIPIPGIHLLAWGGIAVVAILIERWRYEGNAATARDGWQKTGERFQDPQSGQIVDVLYHPLTGTRRYVAAGDVSVGVKS